MIAKKQRLITGPAVEAMLDELEKAAPADERRLVFDILCAQLKELLKKRDEPDGGEQSDATHNKPSAHTTLLGDLIDSRLATEFKGWIFRHLAADVHTQDVLESSVEGLASHVLAARRQPLGAQI